MCPHWSIVLCQPVSKNYWSCFCIDTLLASRNESFYVSLAPQRPSPLLPRWDCWSAASVLPSGRSSLGSGLSQYEGSWCSPVYTSALQSAWYAEDPCLRHKKKKIFFLHSYKTGSFSLITWSYWVSVSIKVMAGLTCNSLKISDQSFPTNTHNCVLD